MARSPFHIGRRKTASFTISEVLTKTEIEVAQACQVGLWN